jgi:hypothetical protein
LEILFRNFEYDLEKLSQPWMYYWLLIPAIGYLVFFFGKWAVLTAPIWIPFSIAGKSFAEISKKIRRKLPEQDFGHLALPQNEYRDDNLLF